MIALALLFAGVLFMAWDMFFRKPDKKSNPYEYDLKSLKTGDTSLISYAEVLHFDPGMPSISGIALDNQDRIYVCGENGVEIFDPEGKRESGFTIGGTAGCLHVGQGGTIYIGMQDHVETYSASGKLLKKWPPFAANSIVTSVAASGKNVFVADAGNKIVYSCDLLGKVLRKIGEKDPAKGIPGFVVPSPYFDLGVDQTGALWVVNPGRHHLEKYDPDGNISTVWGESTMSMEGFCGCCNPSHFALFPDGSFVTSEKAIERVKVYGPRGEFKYVVAGPDSFIEGTRGLDLAVDSKGRILVLDPEKKQVRVFVMKNV